MCAARCSSVKASPGITNGATACIARRASTFAGQLSSACPSVSESRYTSQAFPTGCGRPTSCPTRCGTDYAFAHSTSKTTSTVRHCTSSSTPRLNQSDWCRTSNGDKAIGACCRYFVPTTVLSSSVKRSRVGRRRQVLPSNTPNQESQIRMHTSSAATEPTVKNCSTTTCFHRLMKFAKLPGSGCASKAKKDPMTHWAVARPENFISPPETQPRNCRLDGEAYAHARSHWRASSSPPYC